jgi:hypothetical protein
VKEYVFLRSYRLHGVSLLTKRGTETFHVGISLLKYSLFYEHAGRRTGRLASSLLRSDSVMTSTGNRPRALLE